MVTLNLQNTTEINLITTSVSLANTSLTSLLSNASSSTYINKVVSITVSNNSASAANITLAYYSAAALGGTAYPIASTVSVPAYGSIILIDQSIPLYLKDDSSLGVTAGTGAVLTVTCAYSKISAPAVYLPGGFYDMWGAGSNAQGTLSINKVAGAGNFSSPVQVTSDTAWASISTSKSGGTNYSVAGIKTNGTLWAWGFNGFGMLGIGDTISRSSPVQIGALTNWSKVSISYSSGAIKTDGTLWTWGFNGSGQLGQNDLVGRSSPVQVGALTTWSDIKTSLRTCAGIQTNGTLWVWGNNSNGQLGQNNRVYRSSPTQVGTGTTWSKVSIYYACLATKTDGTLWSWGINNFGQLGQNDRVNRSSPVQVGASTDWSKVFGNYSAFAIKTSGELWSWGINNNGYLAQNTVINRSSPIQVGALTDWSEISFTNQALLAIKTNGTLWTWGVGSSGQLGTNSTVTRSSPVQVGTDTNWVSIGKSTSNNGQFIALKPGSA